MKVYEYILKIKDEFSKGFRDLTSASGVANNGLDQTKAKLTAAGNAASGMDDMFKSLKRTIATVFTIGAIVAFGHAVWEAGTRAEQTSTAYTVLLGNASLAQAKLAELQRFADVSPFNTQETMDAGQALLGFGVKSKDLLPIMGQLGDISMGNANKFKGMVDNYGKMVSAQRANTMDLNQFAIAGVPIWAELEKQTGKSGKALRKYVEENGVGLDTINTIFGNLTKEGGTFFEMMKKQSETTAGKWSTLVSKVEAGYVKLFNAVKPLLDWFLDVGIALSDLSGIMDRHGNVVDMLKIAVTGFAVAWGLFSIELAFTTGIFKGLTFWQGVQFGLMLLQEKATWGLATAQGALNASMFASPITWIVLGVTALVAGFILAYNKCDEFRGAMWGLWAGVKQVFSNIGEFFSMTFEPIFKAIEAFKKGDWGESAKHAAQGLYNVSPLGMAANAVKFAVDGNLTKGVKDQYQWAKGEGMDSKHRITIPGMDLFGGEKKTPELSQLEKDLKKNELYKDTELKPSADNSTSSDGISGETGGKGKGVNVITHLGGIKIEINVAKLDEGLDQVEQKCREVISRIVNGGLYPATQ